MFMIDRHISYLMLNSKRDLSYLYCAFVSYKNNLLILTKRWAHFVV